MNDQTVDLMQPWAFLKQTVGFLGSLRPFVSNNSETLRDWNWSIWSPVSCWTEVGFPWDMKGATKKTGIPYSPLGLSLSGDERNSIFIPFFLDLIQSQLDANWLYCKILRFLLNTNLRSLWKVPNAQPVNRVNGQVGYHPGLSELVSGSSANKLFGESFWMLISVPIRLMYLGPNLEDFLKRPFQLETVDKSVVWWGCLISIVWVWFLNCMDSSWRRVISTLFVSTQHESISWCLLPDLLLESEQLLFFGRQCETNMCTYNMCVCWPCLDFLSQKIDDEHVTYHWTNLINCSNAHVLLQSNIISIPFIH